MNKHIYIFSLIVFIQQFAIGPLWNTFIPLHFYTKFAFSSAFVGILMSLDELIASPTSFVAGKISDKTSDRTFLSTGYLMAGFAAVCLFFTRTPFPFMVFFLISGCLVTSTQVILPKAAAQYMRKNSTGFEFAIVSTCAGLGEWLGNFYLGKIINESSINNAILIFLFSHLLIFVISFVCINKKDKNYIKGE